MQKIHVSTTTSIKLLTVCLKMYVNENILLLVSRALLKVQVLFLSFLASLHKFMSG